MFCRSQVKDQKMLEIKKQNVNLFAQGKVLRVFLVFGCAGTGSRGEMSVPWSVGVTILSCSLIFTPV